MNSEKIKRLIEMALSFRNYKTSIPKTSYVEEKVEESGFVVKTYYLNDKVIGKRIYTEHGDLDWEYGIKNGKYHGGYYYFHEDASIHYKCNYTEGKIDGIVAQWSASGKLIFVSEFRKGTGTDYWCQIENDKVVLSEEREYKNGVLDGYVRHWISNGQLWQEEHYTQGKQHGIEREWDGAVLMSGFPKYFLLGKEVTELEYINYLDTSTGSGLPEINEKDNLPFRRMSEFYLEMRGALGGV